MKQLGICCIQFDPANLAGTWHVPTYLEQGGGYLDAVLLQA